MMRTIGTMALSAALLASASPAEAARPPKARLKIVIVEKDGPARGAMLRCGPDGGNHPHARAACAMLRRINGDLSQIHVPEKNDCGPEVKLYAVSITGHWYGKRVRWGKAYRNGCVMQSAGKALLS